jgi:hypothetical protein
MIIGPGLGRDEVTLNCIEQVIEHAKRGILSQFNTTEQQRSQ